MSIFKKKKDNRDMNQEDKNTHPDNPQENNASSTLEEDILRQAAQAAGAAADASTTEAHTSDADRKPDAAGQADNTSAEEMTGGADDASATNNDFNTNEGKHGRKHKGSDTDGKIQELGEKLAALNDKYVRLYSEYENYRKRTNQEKADLLLNGGKDVLKVILPIVDDMERALKNIPDDNIAKEGVQLVYNKLITTLTQKGVKEIEAKGQKFDENLHEAVTRIPAPDENLKGTVLDVIEKGYMLNDKVLRFPKVVVGC